MTNKFAIITGASTGIGFELASIAAENGYDLLVVADEPRIDGAARDLKQHGTDVRAIEADLSTLQGVDALLAAAGGRSIDLLAQTPVAASDMAFLNRTSPIGAACLTPILPVRSTWSRGC